MSDSRPFANEALRLKEMDPRTYSPLALAYIGDAVYELILVRTMVINHGSIQVNKMHKKSASLVNAGTSGRDDTAHFGRAYRRGKTAVYKRGRNAKSVTTAKHATVVDYRTATALRPFAATSTLTGRLERLVTLISHGFEK